MQKRLLRKPVPKGSGFHFRHVEVSVLVWCSFPQRRHTQNYKNFILKCLSSSSILAGIAYVSCCVCRARPKSDRNVLAIRSRDGICGENRPIIITFVFKRSERQTYAHVPQWFSRFIDVRLIRRRNGVTRVYKGRPLNKMHSDLCSKSLKQK